MNKTETVNLTSDKVFSLIYHSLFEYPLTTLEFIKWQPGKKIRNLKISQVEYEYMNGFFYLKGSKGIVTSRMLRKRNSLKKIQIARKASKLLKKIPFIKMIGLTGSLSMFNAKDSSDIDLMLITRKDRLWISRLITLILLSIYGFKVRRFKDKNEKNKICMNMWMDETNLVWPRKDRNFYTAHEIAQIIPLFDRQKTYQMFLNKNLWLKDYWPNSIKFEKPRRIQKKKKSDLIGKTVEKIAFGLQKFYMRNKITREVINAKKAIFHPIDRSENINTRLMTFLK